MKRKLSILSVGLVTLLATIILSNFYVKSSKAFINLPANAEEQAVTDALEKAYEVLDIPFDQLNLSQLSEVFIDHPYYLEQLSAEEIASLQLYTIKIQGKDALDNFGYLTSMRTKRMHQQRGAELLKTAEARAFKENREVTPEEFKVLKEMNHGREPWIPGHEPFQRKLQYFSLNIEDDKAMVKYDEGVTGRTAVLVKVDGQWYVAGIF